MADQRINIPPPSGDISLNVNDKLTIHAARACTFCCSIGNKFSPDITNVQLSAGDHVYTAITVGTGKYNSSDPNTECNPQGLTLVAKSVQINP